MYYKPYLPLLLLALAAGVTPLPLKAQSLNSGAMGEIVQSGETAQKQMLQEKAAQIVNLLAEKQYGKVRETLAPELAQKLSAEQIGQIWDNLTATTGSVKKLLKSHVINTINADLVVVTAQFEKAKDDFIITFNKQGAIVGVDFPKVDTIDRIGEIFINALATNDFPRARGYLHPYLKAELFPQQVASKWQALIQQTGPMKQIQGIQILPGSTVDKVDVVSVTIKFEKATEDLLLIFDEERRIVGVDFPQD